MTTSALQRDETFPSAMKPERESNIELVRIIAMSMILVHHFIVHVIALSPQSSSFIKIAYPFFLCGVNLFFMISGWFQIRLSMKTIIKLATTIFLFSLVNILFLVAVGQLRYNLTDFIKLCLFPISFNDYWFIEVYLGILITSPLLNAGLNHLNKKGLRRFIIFFSVFTVFSCGIARNKCNPDGYSYMQGVYCYCLAFWLKKDVYVYGTIKTIWCIISYLTLLLLSGIFNYLWSGAPNYINYNSLPIIVSSASLFVFISKLKMKSRIVNALGAAALGCYLLQDGIFGYQFLYIWMLDTYNASSLGHSVFIFATIFICTWITSIILSKPITLLSSWISKRFTCIILPPLPKNSYK